MKVSVVLATYNRLDTLKEVLQALFKQDFPKDQYEILVSDDGSSDGTREYLQEIAEEAPVEFRYRLGDHGGPAQARNWGIQKAQGEIVTFTDDDCIAPPDWLSSIMDAFNRYPQVVGVSGYMEADPETLENNIYARYEKYAHMGDFMRNQQKEHVGGKDFLGGATNNVAYKREVLLEVNGFDETFPFAAAKDADLKERIVDKGYKMVHIPVKVTHKHPYSFKRLMRQAYVRGVGSRHFNIKHNRPSSVLRFFLSSLKISLRFLRLLVSGFPFLVPLAPLVLLYQLQFMHGVISYPRHVS